MKNMRNKILFFGLLITLCVMGCGKIQTEAKTGQISNTNEFELVQRYGNGDLEEYRDAETGVHYFVYASYIGNRAGAGGITVRYNADGTVYVD